MIDLLNGQQKLLDIKPHTSWESIFEYIPTKDKEIINNFISQLKCATDPYIGAKKHTSINNLYSYKIGDYKLLAEINSADVTILGVESTNNNNSEYTAIDKLYPPKVTIVIPVFNTAIYLKECIDSVIKQTYNNLEILILDNKSTDNSYDVIKQYDDERIRVFTNVEGIISDVRNFAMQYVTGDFLLFLDSDDHYIRLDAISILVNKAVQEELDMLGFNWLRTSNCSYNQDAIKYLSKSVFTGTDFTELGELFFKLNFYSCFYLFRTSFIKKYSKLFPKGRYYEDIAWVGFYRLRVPRLSAVNDIIYHYRERPESTTSTIIQPWDILYSFIDLLKENINFFDKNINFKRHYFCYMSCIVTFFHLKPIICNSNLINLYKHIKDLKICFTNFFYYFQSTADKELLKSYGLQTKQINNIKLITKRLTIVIYIKYVIKKIRKRF